MRLLFDECRRRVVQGNSTVRIALDQHQTAKLRSTNSGRALKDRLEHRLQVTGRARNDPQHLRCGPLLL